MKLLKNNKNLEVLVDDEDYEKLSKYTWFVVMKKSGPYIKRSEYYQPYNGKNFQVYLHRQIMNAPKDKVVDHINRNTLDNRKENLRLCSTAENVSNAKKRIDNTSGYFGVYYSKDKKKYFSTIDSKKVTYHLGYFSDKISAAKAYDRAAKKYHKQFAKLNFPKK